MKEQKPGQMPGGPAPAPDEPLALVAAERGRLSLAAVDGVAAALGITPGLSLADARAFLPRLKTAPHDPAGDEAAIARLADWCGRYTPWTAPCSTEEGRGRGPNGAAGVFLDVTGCAHLFGGEAALLNDLLARVRGFGFAARAALAETPGAAWALARFATDETRPWTVAAPGEARAALAPLPPMSLRLPPAAVELMARFGLESIADLSALPRATLTPRFGPQVIRRLDQALGAASGAELFSGAGEPICPRQPAPRYLARQIFAEPVGDPEDLVRILEGLAENLCRDLAAHSQGARRIVFTCYRVDGSLQCAAVGTSRPSRDPRHFKRLFAERMQNIDPGFGIEVVTLAAAVTESLGARQVPMAARQLGRGEAVEEGGVTELVDRLGARLGAGNVRRAVARESHIPERAVELVSLSQPMPGASALWPQEKQRPLRLLSRPEPVEALALLPDYPPARFRWRKVLHEVAQATGPERLSPEWWLRDPRLGEQAPRDYFRVEDRAGRRYWLYRAEDAWFLQGLFA